MELYVCSALNVPPQTFHLQLKCENVCLNFTRIWWFDQMNCCRLFSIICSTIETSWLCINVRCMIRLSLRGTFESSFLYVNVCVLCALLYSVETSYHCLPSHCLFGCLPKMLSKSLMWLPLKLEICRKFFLSFTHLFAENIRLIKIAHVTFGVHFFFVPPLYCVVCVRAVYTVGNIAAMHFAIVSSS